MSQFVYEIPGKLSVHYEDTVGAIIDTWTTYAVSVDEFKTAVLEKGLSHFTRSGGKAWIVDSSQAKGAFSPEIQDCIGAEIFPAFAFNGVKHFITINSQSAITNMSIKSYATKIGPFGIHLLEATSAAAAIEWLAANA